MSLDAKVGRADTFGRGLIVFGAVVAVAGVATAVLAGMTRGGTGVFHGLPGWADILIGIGAVVVGLMLAWAGYVLLTLAAVQHRADVTSGQRGHGLRPAQSVELPMQPLSPLGEHVRVPTGG